MIRTIASKEALLSLATGPGSVRVLLEAQTSMHRFGFDEGELLRVMADADVRQAFARGRVLVEGLALHLPLAQPADEVDPKGASLGTAKVREVVRWAGLWQSETEVWPGHNSPASRVWVSHLDDDEMAAIVSSVPDIILRARIGTRLWLGDRTAVHAAGTVLAVHPLARRRARRLPPAHRPEGRHPRGGVRRHVARHRPVGAHPGRERASARRHRRHRCARRRRPRAVALPVGRQAALVRRAPAPARVDGLAPEGRA